MRKEDDERNEKQSLTRCGKYVGTYCLSACLHHHVSHHHEAAYREDYHLIAQRWYAYGYHVGVVAEQGYCLLADDDEYERPEEQKRRTNLRAEPETLLHPIVELGSVAEAAHRLKALSDAYNDAEDEHTNTRDDAHGGDGGVAVVAGYAVEGYGAQTGKSLARYGGCASGDYFLHESSLKGDLSMTVMNHFLLPTHHEQNDEAAKLTYDRRQCRSAHAHREAEDEEWVEQTVDDRAAHHSVNRILGEALKAHLVVDAEGAHYKRCTQQTDAQILACIWQDSGCTAQENTDRFKKKQACKHYHNREHQCVKETRTCHCLGVLRVLCAELSRDIVARSVSEEERERLNEEHNAEDDTHRRRRLRVYLSDEEGVDEVVYACQEHGYDSGYSHGADDAMYRRMCKELIFLVHVAFRNI